ncbi:MAG: hypothetical protein ACLFPL_04750 [Candidatus Nanoarchaeia archaeon]
MLKMFRDNKKGDINQVFVYAVSTIVVVFVAVLAVSFISTLGSDVGSRTISSFINSIESDLNAMQTDFNSQSIHEYRIPGSISKLVFTTPACSNDEYLDYSDAHYIVVYDSQVQVLDFKEVIEFGVEGGCIELNRSNAEFIELAYINERNTITIEDLT